MIHIDQKRFEGYRSESGILPSSYGTSLEITFTVPLNYIFCFVVRICNLPSLMQMKYV